MTGHTSASSYMLVFSMIMTVTLSSDRDIHRYITGSYTRGQCEIRGLYAHDLTSFDVSETTQRYHLGEQWEARCSNCTCTTAGAVCVGPTCQIPYDFTQDQWCIRWSEDECCCEQMGCEVDGETYDIGERFAYGNDNPCLTCMCQVGWSKAQCLMQECRAVELTCIDRRVTYDDNCCPTYFCPHGATCDTIPDPYPATPRHELLDWYGGRMDPIPLGMTQHFHLDSWTSYVCKCESGGTASCSMQTFGK